MTIKKIGNATLYLGDCLEILSHLGSVDAIVSDPPYGTNNRSSWNGQHGDCAIRNDHDLTARDAALSAIKFDRAVIFGSPKKERPANTRHVLIWDKGDHVGMGDLVFPWKPNFEEIYIIGDGFEGTRSSSTLRFMSPLTGRYHPTEKPVSLMRELVKKTPGTILDPFMGSGSTGVACMELGRPFIGIEIEPKYFEIACTRIEEAQKQMPMFVDEPTPTKQASMFDDESA